VTVLVIGGGISGLTCAWRLRQRGVPVLLLERGSRFGGVIGRIEKDGFDFDVGPQSFSATPPLAKLIDELGLAGQVLRADPRAPRYILLHGRLVRAPLCPAEFFATPLIGWRTKLRILGEPLTRTHPPPGDESIASFVRRKFGGDLLTNLVAPFVSGVYAGDPEKLSLASAFPRLRQIEEQHGSIIRGALMSRRKRGGNDASTQRNRSGAKSSGEASAAGGAGAGGARPSLCNFKRGIAALPEALADKLGAAAVCGAQIAELRTVVRAVVRGEVDAIVRGGARRTGGVAQEPDTVDAGNFHVAYEASGVTHALDVSAIVVATPTSEAGELLAGVEPRFASLLGQIEYASVAQVCMGYRSEQIRGAAANHANRSGRPSGARGFGFLVPRTENLRTLGTVFNSSLFPDRFSLSSIEGSSTENLSAENSAGAFPGGTPDARKGAEGAPSRGGTTSAGAVFTSFLGGATDPDIGRLSEAEIAEIAQAEFSSIIGPVMGISGMPAAIHVARWMRALPQYNLGHARIVDELRQLCAATPGIFLAGNYLAGPSLGTCVEQANSVADEAERFVGGGSLRPGES
jgi:protoporphyrinogen/coproporphyrinogen III oxidase